MYDFNLIASAAWNINGRFIIGGHIRSRRVVGIKFRKNGHDNYRQTRTDNNRVKRKTVRTK